jgi:general secretion pathway protein F
MPHFYVRYYDPAASAVTEARAEAASEAALRMEWAGTGRVVLGLGSQAGSSVSVSGRNARFQVAWWCRELGTLLKAGMTVVEALETLDAQARGTARESVHAQLLRSLREGQALSRAMQGAGAFPAVLVASVTASERTSTLTTALEDYLRYDEMLERLKRQVVSAAIYPAVVVSLGLLISLFLLLYVIPRFSRMYVDFHGEVSVPTRVLMAVSRTLHDQLPWVMGGLVSAVAIGVWAWREGYVLAAAVKVVEALGPLRTQWDHFRHAKLYQSLALMFRGGYTLDEALTVCEGMGLGEAAKARVARTRGELARGRSVAAAFGEAGLTDAVSARLLAVGERSGGFDAVLQTIADRHATTFATFVERATRIVEPLLLLIVALVVGGIVVMMYMPIFDIANGVR